MSLLNSIDRPHVLTAMETWDAAGGGNYMLVRGGVSTHVLLHHGKEYDAAAIAGIAHGLATGRTLTPADIPGGSEGASKALARLGFEVRLTVLTVDGDEVSVVATRTHARSQGLAEGSTVWLTPADGAIVVPRMAAATVRPARSTPSQAPSRTLQATTAWWPVRNTSAFEKHGPV